MDNFIKNILKKSFGIIRIDIEPKILDDIYQFIKFIIVGLSNTVVGYIANIVTLILLKDYNVGWDYFAGNISSFIFGVLWSYYWNSKYVFKTAEGEKRNHFVSLIKTYLSYAFTGLVLNNVFSYILVDILNVSKLIAPLINMILGMPINFLINKLWAFNSK